MMMMMMMMMMILCCLSAYSECAPGNDACVTDPFRCLFMAASAEKEDMICLNDRLGDVVLKVEKLRSGSGQDSSTFITAIDCLKEEIKRIKTAYDLELSRLRYALNDSAFAQILPIRPSYTHSIHQTTFSDCYQGRNFGLKMGYTSLEGERGALGFRGERGGMV